MRDQLKTVRGEEGMANKCDISGKVASGSRCCECRCRMDDNVGLHSGLNPGLNRGFNSEQIARHSIQRCSKRLCTRSTALFSNSFPHNIAISLTLFVLVFLHTANGFNLDIASKMEFEGTMPGSYFGYSVAMLNQGDDDKWYV